ncbi:hypothetical protein [Facilibium subflavum]|uniref:hypothetical protein n=1 Tax=Facilibium subflavum TaxID=2219058 RepID=UPI000E65B235|nr:hypothetical protein [Facilibium subflavum]
MMQGVLEITDQAEEHKLNNQTCVIYVMFYTVKNKNQYSACHSTVLCFSSNSLRQMNKSLENVNKIKI